VILTDDYCYSASVLIAANVDHAMTYMKEPNNVGDWAFGSWRPIKKLADETYQGTSLYDGGETVYRLNVYEEFYQIDYEVGYLGGELVPWIVARLTPGTVVGRGTQACLLTMLAWRNADWSDDDWKLVGVTHEAEVFRIKYLIESAD
jgi:hypothetical protein